ncbi:16 kDa phloem protein 2 [Solanum dulcamara]|uniref:16 kDa phloem protein 2 n=1 Tax=Solanum dulcamara TaxID=45834 RepID=UPI0024853A2B|nr:16 kDa phloem protein 2 [Solanum dulcamara]
MSMICGIQGQLLEVTVVSCNRLKDTEWISRQDPYVCLEYGSTKFRTRTCTDGGKTPTFQEKFVFTLIEGLREFNVVVWNSNTLTYDDLIGSGKIQLQKVLSMGYDDTAWPIQTKTGRHAGEVRLIMFYANANKPATSYAPPSYTAPQPHTHMYSVPPPIEAYQTPSPYPAYPPHSAAYPPTPYPPPQPTAYPPAYPPPSAYPPMSYPPVSAYPPMSYPPVSAYPPVSYPPPTHDYSYPPGPYLGTYPPQPY